MPMKRHMPGGRATALLMAVLLLLGGPAMPHVSAHTPTTAAPRAGAAAATLPAHVAEQIRTYVRSFRSLGAGTHEATLILDPEHLGPVRVRRALYAVVPAGSDG